jgi:transposase
VDRYQRIFVGDVSSAKLVRTRLAKSVLDAGWGMLKMQLQYKCGDTHDRDVNAAKNILSAGRCPPSVSGNESSPSDAPSSQASSRCEAEKSALAAAA